MAEHLFARGRQWYLKLGIPHSLRQHFLSSNGAPKSKLIEPLGDSYEVAKIEASRRHSEYLKIFARLRAGQQVTAEEISEVASPERAWEKIRTDLINISSTMTQFREMQEQISQLGTMLKPLKPWGTQATEIGE